MRIKNITLISLVAVVISGCSIINKVGNSIAAASNQSVPVKSSVIQKKSLSDKKKLTVIKRTNIPEKIKSNCTYIVRDFSRKHSSNVWCKPNSKKNKVTPKIEKEPKVSNNCSYIIRDLSRKNSSVVWCIPKNKKYL